MPELREDPCRSVASKKTCTLWHIMRRHCQEEGIFSSRETGYALLTAQILACGSSAVLVLFNFCFHYWQIRATTIRKVMSKSFNRWLNWQIISKWWQKEEEKCALPLPHKVCMRVKLMHWSPMLTDHLATGLHSNINLGIWNLAEILSTKSCRSH